jgi:hypothetical protein
MNFSMSIYSGFCSQTVVPLLLDKHIWYLKKELEKFLENKTEEGV